MNNKTPWYGTRIENAIHIQSAVENENNYVCRVDASDKQGEANADLIIRSVNSFDALIEACWRIIECDKHGPDWKVYEAMRAARTALEMTKK